MYYIVIPKRNPQAWDNEPLYYCLPRSIGVSTTVDIGREIEKRTAMTLGDVMNVIESMVDIIAERVSKGEVVNLDRFGVFRYTFKSFGKENPEDCGPHQVKSRRVVFRMSSELRSLIEHASIREFPM